RLAHDTAQSARLHLAGDLAYQRRLLRFLENHDEPRAAAAFPPAKARALAVTTATLPGARLFHDGQFEGRKIRLPVFLRRRAPEPPDPPLWDFYRTLLAVAGSAALHGGAWRLCESVGWPDNPSARHLLAWCWRRNEERYVIVVNLSDGAAQG